MIIRNSSVYTNKQKKVIIIISGIVDLIIFLTLVVTIIVTFLNNLEVIGNNHSVIILLAVFCMLPFSDLISIYKKKKSFATNLVNLFVSHKKIYTISNIDINQRQLEFCETIIGGCSGNKSIYLFGKKNKGKTTATLFLLKGLLDNCSSIDDIPWIDNLIFIDCNSNKDEIINFFYLTESSQNRIKKFKDSFIVLDNIERLGDLFFYENIGLFSSNRSCFVIIEDTENENSIHSMEALNKSLCVFDFNSSVISVKKRNEIRDFLYSLDVVSKRVFWLLYLFSLSSVFIEKKVVHRILKISQRKFKRSLKMIAQIGVFITFPFNEVYVYCLNRQAVERIERDYNDDATYNYILKILINNNKLDPEIKWRCLIRSSIENIQSIPEDTRYKLLHKTLYSGNYKGLYNELNKIFEQSPEKRSVLLYEKAYLSFHNGYHKEASKCYKALISTQNSLSRKKTLMLRIIESSHGNPDEENMRMIYDMISDLRACDDFFSVCADYWDVHILSEKGKFYPAEMRRIRERLSAYSDDNITIIKRSIIHRTFTDEIRFHHIIGSDNIEDLYSDYIGYLDSCNLVRKEYYLNLYIEANNIHYLILPKIILSDRSDPNDIEQYVKDANYYYDKAILSLYTDEKSKRAARVKQKDLQMMYSNFDFTDAVNTINIFLIHSQINNVAVHEAFCRTLFVKAYILCPDNISNEKGISVSKNNRKAIKENYARASKIYKEYHNDYGIFRLGFLLLMYKLLVSKRKEMSAHLKALEELSDRFPEYKKEAEIINRLVSKSNDNTLSKMLLLSIIRAYPIILQ